MANWLVVKSGKEHGPFTAQQLKNLATSGKLKKDDLVRREDLPSARPARDVKGLFQSDPPELVLETVPPPIPENFPLWNPWAIRIWALFLGWGFGAFLTARNWKTLGDDSKANHSMIWFYGMIPYWILILITPDNKNSSSVFRGIGIAVFLAWVYFESEPQVKYVKENFGKDYPRKGWLKPLGVVGAVFLGLFVLEAIKSDSQNLSASDTQSASPTVQVNEAKNAVPPPKPAESLSLSKGRMPVTKFLEQMKREEDFEVSTPDGGIEIEGTQFTFLKEAMGEPCRIHIGGKENFFHQNVAAIIAISENVPQEVMGVVAETPFDFLKGSKPGNDIEPIFSLIQGMLPDADMWKLLKEQNSKLAIGGSMTATYGKASIVVTYEHPKQKMRVVVFVER